MLKFAWLIFLVFATGLGIAAWWLHGHREPMLGMLSAGYSGFVTACALFDGVILGRLRAQVKNYREAADEAMRIAANCIRSNSRIIESYKAFVGKATGTPFMWPDDYDNERPV